MREEAWEFGRAGGGRCGRLIYGMINLEKLLFLLDIYKQINCC
jgi:hypothetical protein